MKRNRGNDQYRDQDQHQDWIYKHQKNRTGRKAISVNRRLTALVSAALLALGLLAGCGSESDGRTAIEVFVFKPESVEIFQKLGEKFEEENKDLKVYVNSPGDAYAILKARMVKGNVPDIIGLDATQTYVDYAKADVYEDLTDSHLMESVKPAYQEMLAGMEGEGGRLHAIPFAANVTGVLYNKDIFAELGLSIPTTWQELTDVCEKIQAAGKTPFYLGYKEDWTINSAWNPLAGNFTYPEFYQDVTDGKITFEEAYEEPVERLLKLNDYSQGDIFSYNYNNATVGFANGESVMYMQGNWAIPVIMQTNPQMNLGMFPFPALDEADDNKLCSSIDLMFSITKKSKHKEEAIRFMEFLTSQENVSLYMEDQFGIPALDSSYEFPEALEGIVDAFENGAIVSSPQAYYPSQMSIPSTLQTYMIDGDKQKMYSWMESVWQEAHEE